jgi:hypothetical protein
MEREHFMQVVNHGGSLPTYHVDAAKRLLTKFKNLRRVLKTWQRHTSSLSANVESDKLILSMMEILEEQIDLSIEEWKFKDILNDKLVDLLHQQKNYW